MKGRRALVIGGGSVGEGVGIGRAIACAYAREGATVAVADANIEAARETVRFIEDEGGIGVPIEMDVTRDTSVLDGINHAVAEIGPIEILHNNVGLGKSGPPLETTPEDWRRIQDANVTVLHISAQAVLPAMVEAGYGVLLVTGSIAGIGHVGYPHLAYSVTKAAALHFAKMMAVEYGPAGVRSNAIVAGLIDTPRIETTVKAAYESQGIADWREARGRVVPLRRMGTAEEVADAAVFLCSDRASYINGVCLNVDGGLSVSLPH